MKSPRAPRPQANDEELSHDGAGCSRCAVAEPSASGPTFVEADVDTFRAAMRHLASGVCLVAHSVGGAPAGMTATAVASLSLDPPTLIVCLNRAASTYAGLARGVAFGVSVLGADHRELAERFAGRTGEEGAERFREGRWLIPPSGAPLLGRRSPPSIAKSRTLSSGTRTQSSSAGSSGPRPAPAAARSSTGAAVTINSAGAATSCRARPAFRLKARGAEARSRDSVIRVHNVSPACAVTVGMLSSTSAPRANSRRVPDFLPAERASSRAAKRGLTAVARCAPLRFHDFVRPLG